MTGMSHCQKPMSTLVQSVNVASDSVLIARFQSGDARAFDLLYLRHYDRIHGVIISVVYNPEDALDITQEVFLKAVPRTPAFQASIPILQLALPHRHQPVH